MGRNPPVPRVPTREGCQSRSPAGCPRGHCDGHHQHPGEQRPEVTQRGSPTPPSAELQSTLAKPKSINNNLGKGVIVSAPITELALFAVTLCFGGKTNRSQLGASSPGMGSGTGGPGQGTRRRDHPRTHNCPLQVLQQSLGRASLPRYTAQTRATVQSPSCQHVPSHGFKPKRVRGFAANSPPTLSSSAHVTSPPTKHLSRVYTAGEQIHNLIFLLLVPNWRLPLIHLASPSRSLACQCPRTTLGSDLQPRGAALCRCVIIFPNRSLIDAYLGCFQSLAITNNFTIKTSFSMSCCIYPA